ncbi:xylose operon regulatory protein [Lentisphaera araneosa HTCC2155]|jgi:LacI family transcriptional regulator|uniref:Xylose operon regulatory protein n=1 Tax=Lentisphaera araneosa HTCC2155 TaxID=313628 RepID=A6DPD5_9BACT|nr:substrate-binding domain-containing protein [Lentisphaera araneosa]EDM26431.1 xylose operon regulatory protein [Lentisphaera araneosa HTCC2155]
MSKTPEIILALDWYDYRIHQGVVNVARENGWSLLFLQNSFRSSAVPAAWRGDGAITLIHSAETYQFFQTHKIPVVDLGLNKHGLAIPRVVTDNVELGRMAAEHFLERGFTHFYALSTNNIQMFQERYQAFKETLMKKGYDCEIIEVPNLYDTHLLDLSQAILKQKLSKFKNPAALFAYEDSWAAQWIYLAESMGLKVPNDLAILGADNNPLIARSLSTPLSSVETNQEGLGQQAALVLKDLMEGKGIGDHLYKLQPTSVVTRASTDVIASSNPVIRTALEIMNNDISITAAEVAQQMDMTQQGLQRAFRTHFHLSPGQILRKLRIRFIKNALVHTDKSMEEIAFEAGFTSTPSLYLFFKREAGETPGNYKKNKIKK